MVDNIVCVVVLASVFVLFGIALYRSGKDALLAWKDLQNFKKEMGKTK